MARGDRREGLFSDESLDTDEGLDEYADRHNETVAATGDMSGRIRHILWYNLPFAVMLAMAVFGIALSTFGAGSLNLYWEILTPIYCVLCIVSGWPHAEQDDERTRLIWTQVLHWTAFLVTMHLISSPSIRIVQSDTGVGIDQMALLALGTFVAGVHARAWHISMVGALLALSVPAIAWVERSAMLIILLVILLGVVAGVIWWARRGARRSPITRMTSASNRTKG